MTELYVIETDQRNLPGAPPSSEKHEPENRDSENGAVTAGRINIIIESKIREQEKLWDMLAQRDSNKLFLMKLSFGVFSLFVTAMLAILSLVESAENLVKSQEFSMIFCAALIGMALINFSLIRNIIALKHSRILFLRQINCLRHAIDSCHYALIHGKFPKDKEQLMKEGGAYFSAIGRHRKLPIDNKKFRAFHVRTFESSDNFTIFVIASLTVVLSLIPAAYLWGSGDSNMIGAISVSLVGLFVAVVMAVLFFSKKALDHALEFNRFDSCD